MKKRTCPHGRDIYVSERGENYGRDLDDEIDELWPEQSYEPAEEGICTCCGWPYQKTQSENNISFTGLCMTCGANP